ncbi:hypothetical protein [Terrisporobacter mayombei]|nr:hypothetical protein [Terrisporobacter mayombei]
MPVLKALYHWDHEDLYILKALLNPASYASSMVSSWRIESTVIAP